MKKKRTVGLVFGGKSAEHEVSVRSAQNIYQVLKQTDYKIKLIYISNKGNWIDMMEKYMLEPADKLVQSMEDLDMLLQRRKLQFYYPSQFLEVDVIFPVLHGPYGEDGTVQAFLRMLDIPFVGSSILGSALCMDKDVSKRLLQQAGLPVVPYQVYRTEEKQTLSYELISQVLGKEVFVKPANLGSSVGISKAVDNNTFVESVTQAFAYDTKILIEKAIPAVEIECAVLGNEHPEASLLGQIIPNKTFYSYESKYMDADGASTKIPADLTEKQTKTIRDMAVEAFKVVECRGMARVDFFVDKKTKEIYLNELNTIPGFTDISMYPKMWEASGLSYSELILRLLELGIARYIAEKSLKTTYV